MSTNQPGLGRLSRWMSRYAFRRWPELLGVVLTMLSKIGLELIKPWPMVFLVDYVLQGRVTVALFPLIADWLPGGELASNLIGWSVAATVLIFLLGWAAGLAHSYSSITLGQRMVYDLAGDLFARLQQLSLLFHTRKSVGDNVRRLTADCTCVAVIVKDALLPVVSSSISLVAMLAILWRIDATLTLLAVAVAPYMALVFRWYAKPMMELSYEQQEVESRIYALTEQTFSAIPALQAFGREEAGDQQFRRATRDTLVATLALTQVQLRFKILMGLATAAGTAGILWIGTQHALSGQLSVGAILLFLSYLASLYAPLEAIMYSTSTIQGAAGSARRVREVLEAEREVEDAPGAIALETLQGHVQIENITFGYETDRPVLHEVSLEVRPGEVVALIGATGAGKSTLVSLVPRFFDPWNGRVRVDGHDVRELKVKSLRRNVAIVLQEPFLFPVTIAENIAYGNPHAGLDEIEAAARAAGAHEFIRRLPDGYRTVVGDRGATLSGGERQRVSIARALLKNAPILILDEPTSALDADTEQTLLRALEHLTAGRATLLIAHRMSTVRLAHRIVVLGDGRIVESGTHGELLARGGHYSRLCRLQLEPGAGGGPPRTP